MGRSKASLDKALVVKICSTAVSRFQSWQSVISFVIHSIKFTQRTTLARKNLRDVKKSLTLRSRLTSLYVLMSLRSSSSRMCRAVSSFMITAPVIHLIFSVVLDVEWGHASSFTGISREWSEHSATAALTSAGRRRGDFFFFLSLSQGNTSDANSSISATRYTETLLGSSPCNHGNRGILLVGSSQ